MACSHFGCDAQPGEPCSDTSFAGGEITTTPFLIGGQPAFHAERVATRTQIATIGQPSELPSQKDFDKAVEDSGLV